MDWSVYHAALRFTGLISQLLLTTDFQSPNLESKGKKSIKSIFLLIFVPPGPSGLIALIVNPVLLKTL